MKSYEHAALTYVARNLDWHTGIAYSYYSRLLDSETPLSREELYELKTSIMDLRVLSEMLTKDLTTYVPDVPKKKFWHFWK